AIALGLAQAGLDVLFTGRPPALSTADWDPRVFAVSPSSFELIEHIGVASHIDRTRIAPVYDMEISGDDARHPGRLAFSAYGACVRELATIVESRQLQRALDIGIEANPRISV